MIRAPLSSVKKKTLLIRCDFNVPIENGCIVDFTRIDNVLSTLKALKNQKFILLSHLGSPKDIDPRLSLEPIYAYIKRYLPDLEFCASTNPSDIKVALSKSEGGLLLNNVRFFQGETDNNSSLSQFWASLADIYINNAFSVSHRRHSSVEGIMEYIPSYAGPNFLEEIDALTGIFAEIKKPVMTILGGAKLETKLPFIQHLAPLTDTFVFGGAIANSLFYALGNSMEKSLYSEGAQSLLSHLKGKNILLPEDMCLASSPLATKGRYGFFPLETNDMIVDIGPKTVKRIKQRMQDMGTIIWNGAMGVYENPAFAKGSEGVAMSMANSKAVTCAGGGDTLAVIGKTGVDFSHVSTGGGAFLAWLNGFTLPIIEKFRGGLTY